MIDISASFGNFNGSGPLGFLGKNATGAGATDGTEWIAAFIDNWAWGWTQELFTQAGITPDGTTEGVGNSQIIDALNRLYGPPGTIIEWNINTDPATFGARYLLLNGQGILRANYPDLDANTYVGDGDNATAGAYFRADDAAGSTRNTSGAYLILPESRGYTVRGLDAAASVDPDGASRFVGDNQIDTFQGHWHELYTSNSSGSSTMIKLDVSRNEVADFATRNVENPISDGVNGTPRTSSETRMSNRATQFAIRY